jgi:GTPase involved in cell partitioning and DNA repair
MKAHRGAGGRSKHSLARGFFLNAGLPYPGGRGNSGSVWKKWMQEREKMTRTLEKFQNTYVKDCNCGGENSPGYGVHKQNAPSTQAQSQAVGH